MTLAIIAHVSRAERAAELQRTCAGSVLFLDDGTLGAARNHQRALAFAADVGEPLVVIEDDAILMPNFGELALAWVTRFPERLISFYLGTGHPPAWQEIIADRLAAADAAGSDYLELEQLIHGVCYFVPRPDQLISQIDPRQQAADFAIGDAYRKLTGLPVLYPTSSLVDHPDTDSVDKDAAVLAIMEPRHAWRLA